MLGMAAHPSCTFVTAAAPMPGAAVSVSGYWAFGAAVKVRFSSVGHMHLGLWLSHCDLPCSHAAACFHLPTRLLSVCCSRLCCNRLSARCG